MGIWWAKKQQRLEKWKGSLKAKRSAERVSPHVVLGEYMAGCSIEDLHFLLNFDQLEENIYHLNLEEKSLTVKDQNLPWPVRFVLSRFNRKHIFSTGKLPFVHDLSMSVSNFVQKMRWRWSFQGAEREKPFWKILSSYT